MRDSNNNDDDDLEDNGLLRLEVDQDDRASTYFYGDQDAHDRSRKSSRSSQSLSMTQLVIHGPN